MFDQPQDPHEWIINTLEEEGAALRNKIEAATIALMAAMILSGARGVTKDKSVEDARSIFRDIDE